MIIFCCTDCKSKLRQAHDEIFRLQSELTERKLEVKRTNDEATRLRNTCVTLETTWSDATRGFETATRSRNAAEQALKILQSEKESFVKSRDWYRDQMHAAQVTNLFGFWYWEAFIVIDIQGDQGDQLRTDI